MKHVTLGLGYSALNAEHIIRALEYVYDNPDKTILIDPIDEEGLKVKLMDAAGKRSVQPPMLPSLDRAYYSTRKAKRDKSSTKERYSSYFNTRKP